MGCDIHGFLEVKEAGKWLYRDYTFFKRRNYSVYAFLAGVRNYDKCEPISPLRGLPDNSEYLNEMIDDGFSYSGPSLVSRRRLLLDDGDYHSFSWLGSRELVEFDYSKEFECRREVEIVRDKLLNTTCINGAHVVNKGQGKMVSYRDNLGKLFFEELESLKTYGPLDSVRIVFWFDN